MTSPLVTRRQVLIGSTGLGAAFVLGILEGRASGFDSRVARIPAGSRERLDVLTGDYPRGWFFRQTEDSQNFDSYEQWESQFSALNGIEGKAFAEERHFDDTRTREFFTRFKARHPDQIVLLHFNGKGRRPDFNGEAYFAGHWLHYAGTTATAPAAAADDTIRVADATRFSMSRDSTMFPNMPDDIVIVPPGPDGLDWSGAEQVRLLSIDEAAGTITVRRGQFGTSPIDIPEGAYLAAHVRQRPPALPPPESLWVYNFSIVGPTDPQGRRCIDVLADELGGYFAPGGPIAAFDGLEFDVLYFLPDARPEAGRFTDTPRFVFDEELIDVDNDGVPDDESDVSPGFSGGRNVYGLGTTEFCRLLRDRMPGKLIMADQVEPLIQQRSFGLLNGMESEGFPVHRNPDFSEWSGGLNRWEFWRSRAADPRLNYMVFRFVGPDQPPHPTEDVATYKLLRLALAAAQFTGAGFALPGGWAPPPVVWRENGAEVEVYDELWLGQEQRRNWLGQPTGEAVHIAAKAPDLFDGAMVAWRPEAVRALRAQGVGVTRRTGGALPTRVVISYDGVDGDGVAPDTGAALYALTMGEVELAGADLYLEVRMLGEPLDGYPARIARRVALRVYPPGGQTPVAELYSWFDQRISGSTYFFRDIGPGRFRLELEVEGGQPITLVRLTAHDHPDVMYREFEHGLVLANPSKQDYTFDLSDVWRRRSYRRIKGVDSQDPHTNNGQPVEKRVTVGAIDGLFLVRR